MGRAVNITRVIEEAPVGGYQIMVYALCTLLCLSDGFDTFVPAVAGPALRSEFGFGPEALGSIFSAGLAGNLIGYLVGGPLSDRYGRRWLMIVNAGLFAAFTLLSAFVASLEQLLVIRFLCGIGLAICLSNSLAMIADFAKTRLAVPLVIVAQVGFSVGSILVHSGAARLIELHGWRSVFYAGAALGAAITLALLVFMPESVRFLGLHRPSSPQTRAVVGRISRLTYGENDTFFMEGGTPEGAPLAELFRHGRAATSASLWLMFFAGGCMVFTLTQWLPSLLKTAGMPFPDAVAAGAVLGTAGTVGSLMTTAVSARIKRPVVLICCQYLLAALGLVAIGWSGNWERAVSLSVMFTGFFLLSGWLLMYAVATVAYPDFMRATGLSMSTVAGRAGAVVGPIVVGKALAVGYGTQAIFTGFGALGLIVILGGILYLTVARTAAMAATAVPDPLHPAKA